MFTLKVNPNTTHSIMVSGDIPVLSPGQNVIYLRGTDAYNHVGRYLNRISEEGSSPLIRFFDDVSYYLFQANFIQLSCDCLGAFEDLDKGLPVHKCRKDLMIGEYVSRIVVHVN